MPGKMTHVSEKSLVSPHLYRHLLYSFYMPMSVCVWKIPAPPHAPPLPPIKRAPDVRKHPLPPITAYPPSTDR